MKVSDYIVEVLIKERIMDIFGIPGVGCGHFTDSVQRSMIHNHITYHEQGAAFAACAYGQASGNIGIAYATAGPGATNLLTGIANAFVDSTPALYIVGDKDLNTLRDNRMHMRQRASQEVDIVEMARPITKWSYQIRNRDEVRYAFEKALYVARNGRPGPVLLDVPSDIQRMEYIDQMGYTPEEKTETDVSRLIELLNKSERPLFLVGGGIKQANQLRTLKGLLVDCNIPVVATIVCDDELFGFNNYIGFLGVDGDSSANEAVENCDLLICCGTRLNIKEVGNHRQEFARQAHIVRIDVDQNELDYRVGREEVICADLKDLIPALMVRDWEISKKDSWVSQSVRVSNEEAVPNNNSEAMELMKALIEQIPENVDISLGIGSHRRWFISNRIVKRGWRIFQSAGLASMGFALPAAVGACVASNRPVICIDGDGGLMMNLQELQILRREKLPVTVIVFNNRCLGEIMEFQKKVFHGNYAGTTEESGYLVADFKNIAKAFHLPYQKIVSSTDMSSIKMDITRPNLIEVVIPTNIEG